MDIKIIVVILALVILVLLTFRYRQKTLTPLLSALCISAIWTFYFRYEYTSANFFLFERINVFPLVLWTVGLTGFYLLTQEVPKKYRLATTLMSYFLALASIEAFGYYTLGIRLASNYTSLLGLGVVHAPFNAKMFYVLAGPVYCLIGEKLFQKKKKACCE